MNDITNKECEAIGNVGGEKMSRALPDTTPKKLVGIYGLQNKLKPEKWYIGQSTDIHNRWKNAYERLRCKQQPKIYHALLKYGYDGFNKVIIEGCDPTKEILLEREIYWTRYYNSVKSGYNLKEGGVGGYRPGTVGEKISKSRKGMVFSEDHCKKLSKAKLGKKLSAEHKNKISIANSGKKRTTEFCEKMSKIRTGIMFSEIHCKNIATAKTGIVVSNETKQRMRLAQRKRRKTPISEETRKKMRLAAARREYVKKYGEI